MSEENEFEYSKESSKIKFVCANCGEIDKDDVAFLCNTCDGDELINKEGIYMCPTCLEPGENFECMLCDSTDVKMVEK